MKRFLLFGGDCYYPGGGWDDFVGAFDSAAEAHDHAMKNPNDWWHIVDTTIMKEVEFLAAGGDIVVVP